eukprot:6543401-Alexandrium_andersonii.AAC.1
MVEAKLAGAIRASLRKRKLLPKLKVHGHEVLPIPGSPQVEVEVPETSFIDDTSAPFVAPSARQLPEVAEEVVQ